MNWFYWLNLLFLAALAAAVLGLGWLAWVYDRE
jgi:hypothetical protein